MISVCSGVKAESYKDTYIIRYDCAGCHTASLIEKRMIEEIADLRAEVERLRRFAATVSSVMHDCERDIVDIDDAMAELELSEAAAVEKDSNHD